MSAPEVEAVSWARFALASITVLGLLSLMVFCLKYFMARGLLKPRGGAGRLGFIAALPIDARRRLVLARCDEKEYLLLVGGNTDLLLSTSSKPSSPDSHA